MGNVEEAKEYYNKGLEYFKAGDFGKALEKYDKAIELNPNNADIYTDRGLACENNGLDCAIKNYSEAIKIDPKSAMAHYKRGKIYAIKEEHKKAIKDFDEAIRLQPNILDGYASRIDAYVDKIESSNGTNLSVGEQLLIKMRRVLKEFFGV